MSDLIDLDFETTAENPNSNVMPLGTEALISYNSPSSEKRSSKNQSKENVNKDKKEGSLFDDLGIQDHAKQQQTNQDSKPLSESDILKKFSESPSQK